VRFGSLFTGIGGLDLGLERAGMQCAWQCEIDPYARRVLEKRWPSVARHGDVRHVHGRWKCPYPWRQLWCRACLEPVDLICGGFPCQDISVAGKGKGLAGERSGLWREFARIVDEIRPPWVLIENVPALRTRGLRTVLSDLHASGYDAEWDGLPASAFGAPHRRDRLFVVAHAQQQQLRQQPGRGGGPSGTGAAQPERDGLTGPLANADGQGQLQPRGRIFEGRGRASDSSGPWAVEPDVGRVAHGVPARVDRLRCLGNAVVPQVGEYVGRLILAAHGGVG
jgi:DNA (cytosine-5)-methyltransferase 1